MFFILSSACRYQILKFLYTFVDISGLMTWGWHLFRLLVFHNFFFLFYLLRFNTYFYSLYNFYTLLIFTLFPKLLTDPLLFHIQTIFFVFVIVKTHQLQCCCLGTLLYFAIYWSMFYQPLKKIKSPFPVSC